MNRLITLMLALVSMGAAAQNMFEAGSVYEYLRGVPYPKKEWKVTMTFENAGTYYGRECLALYADNLVDDGAEHELMMVTYVEGDCDKVYYLPREDQDNWLLLFDFTLQPGDECEPYRPFFPDWNRPRENYNHCLITCISREPQSEIAIDSDAIHFIEHNGFGESYNKWIKGFGTQAGVNPNIMGIMCGDAWMTLHKATTAEGVVVYERQEIADDTKPEDPEVKINADIVEPGSRPAKIYTIDGRCIGSVLSGENVTLKDVGIYIIKEQGGKSTKVAVR